MEIHQNILFSLVIGFVLVLSLSLILSYFTRRDNRYLAERQTMLMSENTALIKEMSRKTDVAIDFLREQSILNRQILERVDKR